MRVTVAICTWNRAELLDRTLTEMHNLCVPTGIEWELLVVNNNCTDNTDKVIARHAPGLPLRRLLEARQGHSNARNCAAAAARGDLIIWTDDDVLVDRDWLAAYARAAREWPACSYFGGRVDPWFEQPPPSWISVNLGHLQAPYAILQILDSRARPFEGEELPVGANMAIRKEAWDRVRFDPQLGRVGDKLISGDEVGFFRQLKAAGKTGLWVPEARVQHYIPADRLSQDYLCKWYRGYGKTNVRMSPPGGRPPVCRIPPWVIRQYCESLVMTWLLSAWKNTAWLLALKRGACCRGMIEELLASKAAPASA